MALSRYNMEVVIGVTVAALCTLALMILILLVLQKCFSRKPESKEWTDNMVESICMQDAPKIDERNEHGLAPLHVALSNNCPESARKLIERGAYVNCATTYRRNTPLHYAVSGGYLYQIDVTLGSKSVIGRSTDLAELLLSRGADPNRRNRWGYCPLHVVASGIGTECEARMVWLLFKAGAHVEARSNERMTPLAIATLFKNEACIEKLLLCGANIYDKSVRYERVSDMIRMDMGIPLVVWRHWTKLRAAGFPCHDKWVRKSGEWFYRECLLEVDTMKSTFIDEGTSLYRFLHMDLNDRCNYLDNDKLKDVVCSLDQFPNTVALIIASYNEALERKSILKPAKEAWLSITKMHLPELCIERILNNLSNADLLDLIQNCKDCSTEFHYDKSNMSLGVRITSSFLNIIQ